MVITNSVNNNNNNNINKWTETATFHVHIANIFSVTSSFSLPLSGHHGISRVAIHNF